MVSLNQSVAEGMNEVFTEEEQQAFINAADEAGYDVLTGQVWLYKRDGDGTGQLFESHELALDHLLGTTPETRTR